MQQNAQSTNNLPVPGTEASPSPKRRKVKLPRYSRLNERIIEELDALVLAVPARRLSRNLRNIFFHYIYMEQDALLGPYAKMPEDLYFLLQLLDVIDDELGDKIKNRKVLDKK